MHMYEDQSGSFDSSDSSGSCPDLSTMSSSYSSTTPWDCSVLSTPPSTRRPSFDSVKLEEMSCHTPSSSRTPERYGSANGFYPVSNMTHKMLNGFQDQDMMFGRPLSNQAYMTCQQNYSGPIYSSFPSQDSLPTANFTSYGTQNGIQTSHTGSFGSHQVLSRCTPSLDMDLYSPNSAMSSSPVSGDFVVPSQTTFVDSFDLSSPMGPMGTGKPLQFESPLSEYEESPNGNQLPYFMSPSNDSEHASPSTTPSRQPAQRQRYFQPLESSVVLHRVQSEARVARKRVKREFILPNNLSVQKQAKRHCSFPGCQGRFQRQEHLKRHMKTHENEVKLPCQFCGKEFGRADNLKSHIKLHTDPNKKSSRTQYFEDAQRVYDEMSRKSRKTGTEMVSRMG